MLVTDDDLFFFVMNKHKKYVNWDTKKTLN